MCLCPTGKFSKGLALYSDTGPNLVTNLGTNLGTDLGTDLGVEMSHKECAPLRERETKYE